MTAFFFCGSGGIEVLHCISSLGSLSSISFGSLFVRLSLNTVVIPLLTFLTGGTSLTSVCSDFRLSAEFVCFDVDCFATVCFCVWLQYSEGRKIVDIFTNRSFVF